jgi:hypothetical protein
MIINTNLIVGAFAALLLVSTPDARANTYPVKTCVVTGDDLGDDPLMAAYKGRQIPLCCKSCVKKFNANPEKYIAAYNKELARHKS